MGCLWGIISEGGLCGGSLVIERRDLTANEDGAQWVAWTDIQEPGRPLALQSAAEGAGSCNLL
jgi:hypothetical protein